MVDKTLKSRCFMLVPITSIIRGCPNKAGCSNFDNKKLAISLTVKISEALRYSRLHSSSLALINFDDSLTNCEILQLSCLVIVTHIGPSVTHIGQLFPQIFGRARYTFPALFSGVYTSDKA